MNNSNTTAHTPSTFSSLYIPVGVLLALSTGILWLAGYGPGGSSCSSAGVLTEQSLASTSVSGENVAGSSFNSGNAVVSRSANTNNTNNANSNGSAVTTDPAMGSVSSTIEVDDVKKEVAAVDASATTNQNVSDQQSGVIIPKNENVYFAISSSLMKNAERNKLNSILDYLKSNSESRIVLSGYHDSYGNAASNEKLAHRRALAVQKFFMDAGIQENRIEMTKPVVTVGTGSNYEARRVEVSILK